MATRGVSTREAVEKFLTAKRAGQKSKQTVDKYALQLGRFADFQPTLPATPEDVEAFLLHWQPRMQPISLNKLFGILRTFLIWCEKRLRLPSPHREVETPKYRDAVPRVLDWDELKVVIAKADDPRARALLLLLADTGMRVGEAASLVRSNMHDGYVVVSGKVGPRMVPVSAAVLAALRDLWSADGESVWWGKRGRMTVSGLKQLAREALKRAGIEGHRIGPHTLRHTFATLWEGNETDMQQIGGWEDERSVRRYRHFRVDRARRQQAVHSPVQRLLRGEERADQLPMLPGVDLEHSAARDQGR